MMTNLFLTVVVASVVPLTLLANPEILKLVAGDAHTCALYKDGTAQCWGGNFFGALGLGNTIQKDRPMEKFSAGGGAKITDIQTGTSSTCMLINDGSLKCFGLNASGQLGQGVTGNIGGKPTETPDKISAINLGAGRKVRSFFMQSYHVCAILDDNTLKCWGNNYSGQLGLGDIKNRGKLPNDMGDNLLPVSLGTNALPVSGCGGGGNSCVLLADHTVKCWGEYLGTGNGGTHNLGTAPGQMGDNLKRVDLGTGVKVAKLACGNLHTCALTTDGRIKCFGWNYYGNLGLGLDEGAEIGDSPAEMGDALPFVNLGSGIKIKDLSCGEEHCCVLFENNATKCWGGNDTGSLGVGDERNRGLLPSDMGDNLPFANLGKLAQVTHIYLGGYHSCARLSGGVFKCWGRNDAHQLGNGTSLDVGTSPNHMGDNLKPIQFY